MKKHKLFERDSEQIRYYKKNGYLHKCSEIFKNIDMYSIPVTLRFKG